MKRSTKRKPINLALQGGGAHGAFTWGVLDRLLEADALDFGWISATSAGAVNAAALACGLAEDGPRGARMRLKAIWEAIYKSGLPDLVRLNPMLAGMSKSGTLAQMAQLFSPYDINPLGLDPLRNLLEAHIDFARIRGSDGPELLIAATDVSTGAARFFRRAELTVEAVLASACLPTIHHAVVIDGASYWDGGFASNPDLPTLAAESPVADTLLVQLTPFARMDVPTSTREIAAHINQLTFNAPLLRDIERIATVRRHIAAGAGDSADLSPEHALAAHRFHLIDASRYTSGLAGDSKGQPELQMLNYLHGAGQTEAGKWLDRHLADIGVTETADLPARLAAAGSRGRADDPDAGLRAGTSPATAA